MGVLRITEAPPLVACITSLGAPDAPTKAKLLAYVEALIAAEFTPKAAYSLPGIDAPPPSGLPFPQQQGFDIARVGDANNRLIVHRKLKAIPMVPEDRITNAMADGPAIVGRPSRLDFRHRCVHEDDQEPTAIVVGNLLASVA